MTTVLHMSDLHFGKNDPQHMQSLLNACRKLKPDIVAISGDFTQRARKEEFAQAQAFIDSIASLGIPVLAIAGNHDIRPHHHVLRRALMPYDRYNEYIGTHAPTSYRSKRVAICGVNTVRARKFKDGHISDSDIRTAVQWFATAPKSAVRVVMTHHPLDLPARYAERKLTTRSGAAVRAFAQAHVAVYLSGHYHRSSVVTTAERYADGSFAAIAVQAGTVSLRGRGEAPSFNLLSINAREIAISTYIYGKKGFAVAAMQTFRKTAGGWRG